MSQELNISLATVYRKLKLLEGVLSIDVKKEKRNYKIIKLWKKLAHPKTKDSDNIR